LVNIIRFFVLVSLAFLSSHSIAVQLGNLYNASVAVPSQDPSDRMLGFEQALHQVLIRVTGDEELLQGSSVNSKFRSPENYVLSFAYRENPAYSVYLEVLAERERLAMEFTNEVADVEQEPGSMPSSAQTGQEELTESLIAEPAVPDQYMLDVAFAESPIEAGLQSLSLPIWGRSRPSILVWVVMSDEQGQRSVIGASELDEVLPELTGIAETRGLPLFIPVADLTDLSLLDVDGLWGLFSDSHIDASKRYGTDAVAIVRLQSSITPEAQELDEAKEPVSQRQWRADWQLFLGEQTFFGESAQASSESVSKEFVARLASVISTQYAISGVASSEIYTISVLGIDSFEDYVDVQRYLQDLAPVASVNMLLAEEDQLTFELRLRDTREMLSQHLSLGRKLIKREAELDGILELNKGMLVDALDKFVWRSGS
jgi:hypothetical protein